MAVNGKNRGSTYQELFGTTSPVTGSAPTDVTDGQPMDGLSAITPIVSTAVSSVNLSGAGTLQAYILDAAACVAPCSGTAASSDATTITLNESALTDGFVVGMSVRGGQSQATGIITSIGGSGNKVITCSAGVTGTVIANERIFGTDLGRWMRFPDADYTVAGTTPDQVFLAFSLLTPRKGRIKWVPNGVTFASGSAGITVTQAGQASLALHDSGYWGG